MTRRLITFFLVIAQFSWGTLAYTADLVRFDSRSLYRHPELGLVLYQPVHKTDKGYVLRFDESLKETSKPLYLLDSATNALVARIQKQITGFNITISGDAPVLVEELLEHSLMNFLHGGALHFTGRVSCPLVIKAKSAHFDHDVLSAHLLSVDAEDFTHQNIQAQRINLKLKALTNEHSLRAQVMEIIALTGQNSGQIISDDSIRLEGDFTNEGTIAAAACLRTAGAKFVNAEGAHIVAGGNFISKTSEYEDHGDLTVAGMAFLHGDSVSFGESFNYSGTALKILAKRFASKLKCLDAGEDVERKITVRDFVHLEADAISELEGYILQDPGLLPAAVAAQCLNELLGRTDVALTPLSVRKPGVMLQSRGDFTSLLDINVANGSVLLEGDKMEVYGHMWHGSGADDETVLVGKQLVITHSNMLGEKIRVIAPLKQIGKDSSDTEGEISSLKAAMLCLRGVGDDSGTYIDIPLQLAALGIQDTGRVDLFGDIYGRTAETAPEIFVKANEISGDIDDLEAALLHLEAEANLIFRLNSFCVGQGELRAGKEVDLFKKSATAVLEAADLLIDAPKIDLRTDTIAKSLKTKGTALYREGTLTADTVVHIHSEEVLSEGETTLQALMVHTGIFRHLGELSAVEATIAADTTTHIFDSLKGRIIKIESGTGGTSVHHVAAERLDSTSKGETSIGSADIERMLRVVTEKGFTARSLLGKYIKVDASGINITALDASLLADLTAGESGVSVATSSGKHLEVLASGAVSLEKTTVDTVSAKSTKGAVRVVAEGTKELALSGETAAHADLTGVGQATVNSKGTSSVTGSAKSIVQRGASTIADNVVADELHQDAIAYAAVAGDITVATIAAPMAVVAGGSNIGTLTAKCDNLFLNEDGEEVDIAILETDGGRLHTAGKTTVGSYRGKLVTLSNTGEVRFGATSLDMDVLLNGGMLVFEKPAAVSAAKGFRNTGSIKGYGGLEMSLPHQFGLGNIAVEKLSNGEAHDGLLIMRLSSTILPERLLGEKGIKADELVHWVLQGDQTFYRKTNITQKTAVTIAGDALIYGGFNVENDLSLLAHDIVTECAAMTGSGSVAFGATAGSCSLKDSTFKVAGLSLEASADVVLERVKAEALKEISLRAGRNVCLESTKRRIGGGGNYYDVKDETSLHTPDHIRIFANGHIIDTASRTFSGIGTTFTAGGTVFHSALPLERQRYDEWDGGHSREYHLDHATSSHHSDGAILSTAGDTHELYAADFKGKTVVFMAKNGVHSHAVQNRHIFEYTNEVDDDSLFGGGSTTVSHSECASISQGSTLKADDYLKMVTATGDIVLTAVKVTAPKTVLEAMDGIVKILAGENHHQSQHVERESSMLWQSVDATSESHTTYTASDFSGLVEITAKEIVIDQIKGQAIEFINRLNAHGGDLHYNVLQEIHNIEHMSASGPTPALAALVAIAITIATSGAGAELGFAAASAAGQATAAVAATATTAATAATITTAGTVISGMTAAAFTGICSQAAVALLNAKGDIGAAAKSLFSSDSLKGIAIQAVTAGVTQGVMHKFNMNGTGLGGHIKKGFTGAAVSAGVNTAAGREVDAAALAATAATSAVASHLAGKIGDMFAKGLDPLAHVLLHAGVGAAAGAAHAAVAGGDLAEGAFAGGLAAAVAEMVAESVAPSDAAHLESDRESAAKWGKLSGAFAAFVAGKDVNIAATTAATAIDNNYVIHRRRVKKMPDVVIEYENDSELKKFATPWDIVENSPGLVYERHLLDLGYRGMKIGETYVNEFRHDPVHALLHIAADLATLYPGIGTAAWCVRGAGYGLIIYYSTHETNYVALGALAGKSKLAGVLTKATMSAVKAAGVKAAVPQIAINVLTHLDKPAKVVFSVIGGTALYDAYHNGIDSGLETLGHNLLDYGAARGIHGAAHKIYHRKHQAPTFKKASTRTTSTSASPAPAAGGAGYETGTTSKTAKILPFKKPALPDNVIRFPTERVVRGVSGSGTPAKVIPMHKAPAAGGAGRVDTSLPSVVGTPKRTPATVTRFPTERVRADGIFHGPAKVIPFPGKLQK